MNSMTHEDAVNAICEKTGKTSQQAEAFLNILGSAFARRGWTDGQPLSEAELATNLNTFVGEVVSDDLT